MNFFKHTKYTKATRRDTKMSSPSHTNRSNCG
jgi:hypothetical protein